jgi:hypothetical protein
VAQDTRRKFTKHELLPLKANDAPVNHVPHLDTVLFLKAIEQFLHNRRIIRIHLKHSTVVVA